MQPYLLPLISYLKKRNYINKNLSKCQKLKLNLELKSVSSSPALVKSRENTRSKATS